VIKPRDSRRWTHVSSRGPPSENNKKSHPTLLTSKNSCYVKIILECLNQDIELTLQLSF
jgi:hypothetical protein